ncbi:hypothetical protein [Rudaea sp.]|uniref:hypothetical protein n=1 Tax=Rudaea sp. TaxID=2136325 RepID=UPI00321FFCF5
MSMHSLRPAAGVFAIAAACAICASAAFAQEGPLYNCPPGYLWTRGGCVQAPSRPAQGQKTTISPGPKAHSLAPKNPDNMRTTPKPLPRAQMPATDLRPDSKPKEIPPKQVKSGNPLGSPHGT